VTRGLPLVLLVAGLTLGARPPTPEEAPHGIANQAADPSTRAETAKDQGLVAVPEPSEKALRYARGGNVLWFVDMLWGLAVPGVIGWNLRSTWFQRRAGLATLVATTAGGRQAVTVLDVPDEAAVRLAHDAHPLLVRQFLVSPETSATAT